MRFAVKFPTNTSAADTSAMPASQGHVSPETGRDGGLAEAGIAEHLFHEHRAAEDLGDLGELERDGRERQIAQAVADERLAAREAAGPSEADVVAVQHINGLGPGVQRHVGHPHHR